MPEEYKWTTEWPMKIINKEVALEAGDKIYESHNGLGSWEKHSSGQPTPVPSHLGFVTM